MLEAGEPAVEAMTEYVRASGQLGHTVPEPARLRAAYTAEDGLDLHALDADHRTLADAVADLEEALLLQDGARHELAAAWRGTGAGAAAENLLRHGQASGAGVDRLRAAAVAVGELRDRLSQLIDTKVNATQDIEARGRRAEWLGAARTVTTGAGDRADASETVDLQVAPFVANDIARDWLPLMCDTESAIRQAYRDAIAAMAGEVSAGSAGADLPGVVPVGAEQHSIPAAPGAPAATVPAAFAQQPAATPPQPVAAAPPVDPPAAAPAAASMPGGAAPFGSGMSGLSGIGQSVADILSSLFGAGGQGIGESLSGDGEFDASEMDAPADPEIDDRDEDDGDDGEATEDPEDEESPEETDEAVPAGDPAVPTPLPPAPEPAAPTPVPEPPAEPLAEPPAEPLAEPPAEPMAAPALDVTTEPVPAETPCEIAADALPQAGP